MYIHVCTRIWAHLVQTTTAYEYKLEVKKEMGEKIYGGSHNQRDQLSFEFAEINANRTDVELKKIQTHTHIHTYT